MEAASFVFFL